ncbi:15091_t:CDS:2, partial [Racocetra fulgida]
MDKTQIIIFAKNVLDAIPGTLNYSVVVPKPGSMSVMWTSVYSIPRKYKDIETSLTINETGSQVPMEISPLMPTQASQRVAPLFPTSEDVSLFPASPKKRITESVSVETTAKKVKKTGEKKATKKESNALNQLIDELIGVSSTNSESSSTTTITVAPQDMEKLETLIPLYQNIISAESDNEKTSLNDDIKKQLGEKVTETTLWKRTERAKKIYAIFSEAGEDKIQKVKSLTANAISKLPWA